MALYNINKIYNITCRGSQYVKISSHEFLPPLRGRIFANVTSCQRVILTGEYAFLAVVYKACGIMIPYGRKCVLTLIVS